MNVENERHLHYALKTNLLKGSKTLIKIKMKTIDGTVHILCRR